MSLLRTFLALLITPLLSPLAGLLVYAFHTGGLPRAFVVRSFFSYYGILAYVVTAVLGLPSFLLLRYSRLGGKLSAAVLGGLIAFATGFAAFELVPLLFTTNNVEGYITWTATGAVSGLLFWLIAAGGRVNDGAVNTPRGES